MTSLSSGSAATEMRSRVPAYVPWLVRVPVVLNLGFIVLSCASFLSVLWKMGLLQSGELDFSVLSIFARPLTMMVAMAVITFVLLIFLWNYSRTAAVLLVGLTLYVLVQTGLSVLHMRANSVAISALLVPSVVRLAMNLAALVGTFLYHSSGARSTRRRASDVIGE